MDKESLAWLVIRVIGLLLLGGAIFHMVTMILNFILNTILVTSIIDLSESIEGDTIRLPTLRWDSLVYGLLLLPPAFYFLRYGTTVHRWLVKE